MHLEPWIKVDDLSYHVNDFKKKIQSPYTWSDAFFDFCHQWLSGNQHFTLKTSGSTGVPKEISVTRKQLKASARLTIDYLQLSAGETALICLDVRYIAGIMMVVRALEAEMNMIVLEPSSNPFEKFLQSEKIDFAAFVPMQISTMIEYGEVEKLNDLRSIIIGGAAIPKQILDKIRNLKASVFATYGMTETISHIALQRLDGAVATDYYQTLGHTKVNLDERGCLVIHAPHLSEEAIVTNDLAILISETKFKWQGRFDNIINSGGIKILPEQLEEAVSVTLKSLRLPNRFFITGLSDDLLGNRVALIIEGNPFTCEVETRLLDELKANLSRFEVPKTIYFIDSFAQTPTGKIDKIAIKATLNNLSLAPSHSGRGQGKDR